MGKKVEKNAEENQRRRYKKVKLLGKVKKV
jgi:hypothetical protein